MFLKYKYERVQCRDGFTMSVQAGRGMYCTPRCDDGPYSAVEVGYPSSACPILSPYAEDPNKPTRTVYGWVPAAKILECVAAHGGIESGELPPL